MGPADLRPASARRQERPHRGVAEHQLAFGREERDRVLEVFHDRLEFGRGRGRRRQGAGANGGELCADRFERAAEIGKLLPRQIEPDVELAAAEAGEAALNDMNRPEHPLREQRRDHGRHRQRDDSRVAEARQCLENFSADEQRRHADANRAEGVVAGQDLLAKLVAALLEDV